MSMFTKLKASKSKRSVKEGGGGGGGVVEGDYSSESASILQPPSIIRD